MAEQGELGPAGHANHLIASRIFTSLQTRISYTAPFFHNSRCIVAEVFMVRTFTSFLVVAALMSPELSAQQPPLPPEVGNAVLLATHSIQVDRDVVVTRGDLVVNEASAGPWLGERELSLDQGVRTPAGFAVKANGVDIDAGAIVGGDVRCNVIQNGGTILGSLVTPLTLPVIATLPTLPDSASGTENVDVANGQVRILGTG